jgi:hypothetical protein
LCRTIAKKDSVWIENWGEVPGKGHGVLGAGIYVRTSLLGDVVLTGAAMLVVLAVLFVPDVLFVLLGYILRPCWWILRRDRHRKPLDPSVCSKCGYPKRGLPEPRCPECGTAFSDENGAPRES